MPKPTPDLRPVITDTSHSPHAGLQPVPVDAITLTDEFWAPRRALNREVTLRTQYEHLESTGRLDNFRRAAGTVDGAFQGLFFNDSDIYKWLEAASWTLATDDDPELEALVDDTIDLVAAAQEPDGYLDTYFTIGGIERWSNLRDLHELYCAGHLFQAAVAHYRATGKRSLLDIAQRFADLICETFGPDEGQIDGVPGHPEIEMGLVELARATGEARYLEQASYFIDARGQGLIGGRAYHQDHRPFRELDRLAGHAVRALYLSAGATDVYAETGDEALMAALVRLWERMARRQMYVTGGLGSRHRGEAVGADYELPNARAYAETCAGIANVMWSWRMLQLSGEAPYADLMERALYNAALPGISLDGKAYYYINPLASDGVPEPAPDRDRDVYRRQPWFTCACCPPNIARTIAKLPGYLYGVSENTVWIHTYAANEAEITLPGGETVRLVQRTRYPWSGRVIVETLTPGKFALRLRIPGWCRAEPERDCPTVSVNGEPWSAVVEPGTYVEIARTWAVGDSVCISLPMPIRQIVTHPYALENTGRVALMRGPLLYCLEGVDHPDVDLRDVVVPKPDALETAFRKDLLGGVQVLEGEGWATPPADGWQTSLYRPAQSVDPASKAPLALRAIPYFAWANRAVGAMQVWLRRL
ncbi:MAG: glycoside hydrolase family 127 protein [Anaerolineae bacterium]